MGYGNFRATKLSNDIDAVTSSIKIDTLPRDSAGAIITSGRLVIEPRNTDKREIIKFTNVDVGTTTLTGVLRGQGGTTATTHSKGATVEMNITAEDLEEALGVPNQLAIYEREIAAGAFIVPATGVVAQASGLTGSFSNITYYINGFRYTKSSIANKVYTVSKDTYVFISITGTVTYTEVSNGAAAPATPADNILVAVVVTNASTITSVSLKNRGSIKSDNIDWTTSPYKVILRDNTNGSNASTYKTFNLTNLVIGATYEVVHTSPTLGIASDSRTNITANISVTGQGMIASAASTVPGSSFSNPRENLIGTFVATATSHTVTMSASTNGAGLSLADTVQRTTIKRIVGEDGF